MASIFSQIAKEGLINVVGRRLGLTAGETAEMEILGPEAILFDVLQRSVLPDTVLDDIVDELQELDERNREALKRQIKAARGAEAPSSGDVTPEAVDSVRRLITRSRGKLHAGRGGAAAHFQSPDLPLPAPVARRAAAAEPPAEAGTEQKEEEEKGEEEETPRQARARRREEGSVKPGLKINRDWLLRFLTNYLSEEIGAREDLLSLDNLRSFINYIERANSRGGRRNINFYQVAKRANFRRLLPSANVGRSMDDFLRDVIEYFNAWVIPNFNGLRFPQIARNWWEQLEAGKKLIAGADGQVREGEGEARGVVRAPIEKPPTEVVGGGEPFDPSHLDPGGSRASGGPVAAGQEAGAAAAGAGAALSPELIISQINEIFDRPARPPTPSDIEHFDDLDSLSDEDILGGIRDLDLPSSDDELEPLIRRGVGEEAEQRSTLARIRDMARRRWAALPNVDRNRIINAVDRWIPHGRNARRVAGVIGALIITGIIGERIMRLGEPQPIPEPMPDPTPDPEPTPQPQPEPPKDCVKICPEDDPEPDPTPAPVPDDEHPSEGMVGDTFQLTPAVPLNAQLVNKPSPYPPEMGLSFQTGAYDMNNPLIRGNIMNDAIRYGGKLFYPENPLPPVRPITRGNIQARAPENINEIVTQKPMLNTGEHLHAPFNRAFQEFEPDTGKRVTDYVKSRLFYVSFAC
jgi:hypothetical protein